MSMADDAVKDLHDRILKTLDHFRQELVSIRTGRANLHLLDGVRVDYYGTPTPLSQVATLAVADARLFTVMRRASATASVATWLSGVGVP